MSQVSEYSTNVWVRGKCVMERCVAHCDRVASVEDAAQWAYAKAVSEGIIGAGQPCEVDVSIDASDDWRTITLPKER
jgi:hypothetical protein